MAQNRYASAYNGYLPQATGLVVAFVRKPDEFPINKWVQYVPTPVKNAAYVSLETDQQVREYDDAALAWEDGGSRKQMGQDNKVGFQYIPFRTQRRNRSWTLGYETIDQTKDFKIKPVHMDTAISQIMINRTRRCVTLLETVANWGVNVGTANTMNNGRGKWSDGSDDPNSPNYNAIFASLQNILRLIHLFTNGKVKQKDLIIVLSPGAAIAVSLAPEIVNYCRESPYSKEILEKGLDPQYATWGLPAQFKSWEFVVEDTMRVSQQANATSTQATTNRGYVMSDNYAHIISRKGGIDGEYGTQNYSTITLQHYGPLLSVEAFDDPEDHLVRGHVSEDTKEILVSNLTGFLLQGIV